MARLRVAGRAEDGCALAELLARLATRSGLRLCGRFPRRGLAPSSMVSIPLEASAEPVSVPPDDCDLLLALDGDEALSGAGAALAGVVFDADAAAPADLRPGAAALPLPFAGLKVEPRHRRHAMLGAAARVLGLDLGLAEGLVLEAGRAGASEETAAALQAARAGHAHAGREWPLLKLALPAPGAGRPLLGGEAALALGALAAGCKFAAWDGAGDSPAALTGAGLLRPSAGARGWLASLGPGHGVVVRRAPGATAAAFEAAGAAHCGVRALALLERDDWGAASGAVEFAAEAGIPLVAAVLGGSWPCAGTGRTCAVLAPSSVLDAFNAAVEAFNLAERFQLPVALLLDAALAERVETVPDLDFQAPIVRGLWAVPGPGEGAPAFDRWADACDGIPARAVPGHEGLMFAAPAPVEARATGPCGTGRRWRAMAAGFKPLLLEGPREAELTLVGAGSAAGAMRRVMAVYNAGGAKRVNALSLRWLHPFPAAEVLGILRTCRRLLTLEPGPGEPLARLIRGETGVSAGRTTASDGGESCLAAADEVLHA